jgi:MinD superfamily P-loop ATPase
VSARELVVISGKGGTGKTSIVAGFAALAGEAVLADCDVDAADLHLVLSPEVRATEEFRSGRTAEIRGDDCVGCGACLARCRFGAVTRREGRDGNPQFLIDRFACEGCGVCVHFCPVGAIDFPQPLAGHCFTSETRFGPMIHARLGIAEENSGKLVSLVRKRAREVAAARGLETIIVDGSPGIGCPVIASITGASLVLVVTEPTLSGRHDLERVLELAAHFRIPAAVVLNKADLNPEVAASIAESCLARGAGVVGEIPYDTAVTRAQLAALSVVEFGDGGPAGGAIRAVWREVRKRLEGA